MNRPPPLVEPTSVRRIGSQFGEEFHRVLAQQRPDLEIVDLPRDLQWPLPQDLQVLLAYPFTPSQRGQPQPAGWPFGLKWIQLISIGLDNYPPWFLRGPLVSTARGTSSQTIADYVMAQVLRQAFKLDERRARSFAQWKQSRAPGIGGQTMGIFGFGGIGRAVAQKASALGMKVLALRASDRPFDVPGVDRAADLEQLLARSDHLVLAAPDTPGTRHVINAQSLALARPGLHLINVARGSLVDQAALLEALDANRIDHASLDVTDPEPLPDGHPLYAHPRVHLTPHTSAFGPQVAAEVLTKVINGLRGIEQGQSPADLVDLAKGY